MKRINLLLAAFLMFAIGMQARIALLRDDFVSLGDVTFFVTNAAVVGGLALTGHAWVYWAWVVADLTTFNLFVRIRSLAEHACTDGREQWSGPRPRFCNRRGPRRPGHRVTRPVRPGTARTP